MTDRFRAVRQVRFANRDGRLSLIVTADVGTETVVEEVPFGEVPPRDVLTSLEDAVVQVRALVDRIAA